MKQAGWGTGGAVHPSLEAKGEPCKHQGCSSTPSLALGSTWAKGRIPTGSSCPSLPCSSHPCAWTKGGDGERDRTKGQDTLGTAPAPSSSHWSKPQERGMTFLAEHGDPWAHRGPSAAWGTQVSSPGGETGEHKDHSSPWKRHSSHLEQAPAPSSCCWKGGRWQIQGTSHPAPPTLLRGGDQHKPQEPLSVRKGGLRAADDSGTSTSKLG